MHMNFFWQVLSESVSKALHLTGGEMASETAHFVGMVDHFFDCLNVHKLCTWHSQTEVFPNAIHFCSRQPPKGIIQCIYKNVCHCIIC